MGINDRSIILKFKERIPKHIREHLGKIIIFGSRIKSNVSRYADLDLAVLLKYRNRKIEKELEDIVYDLMLEHDFKPIISIKIFEVKDFERRCKEGFSFYRHVREGITI